MTALAQPMHAPAAAGGTRPPVAPSPARALREDAFTFACEGETLMGVLHHPADGAPAAAAVTGVVLIVGGPQYRAGSHRQFVHLARALATAGHPVLRFDVRGMGDSTGTLRHFEQITPDIGAAIDALQQRAPRVERVVLWGLCDGASAALLYLHDRRDERVGGLCLLNPWMRSEASLARTHVKHYYRRRLLEASFWRKLLTGGVAASAARALMRSAAAARQAPAASGFRQRMAVAWRRFDGPVQVFLSGQDYTAKEFLEYTGANPQWHELLNRATVERQNLPAADHTLSERRESLAMEAAVVRWLSTQRAPSARAATS
jgi:exosortase A-associated hydrolase 1